MLNPQSHVAIVDSGPSLRFDASATPLLYLGVAAAGASESENVWQLARIDVTSGVTILYANGSNSYAYAWSNRASLTYR